MGKNPYRPYPVRIEQVWVETEDRNLRTFRLAFLDPRDKAAFSYIPGQFAEMSVAGVGEAPFGIASSPTEEGSLLFTVNRVGAVTTALHQMSAGQVLGVRGPLGNGYPLDKLEGRDLLILAGGFAVTTLRSAVIWLLDPVRRAKYGRIMFVYGARTPGMLMYGDDWRSWQKRGDIETYITVDRPHPDWDGLVGFGIQVVEQIGPQADNAAALVCGPPVMIKFAQPVLSRLGFNDDQIIVSLENRMKCGLGFCGRCNVGPDYVCLDGPVFTLDRLAGLPQEY